MSEIVLQARRREPGRSTARQLRRESMVPGIFYHHGEEPIAIVASELALRPLIFTTESHLVRMRLDDGVEKTCVLKDIDFDPITDRPVHFDLQGVAAGEKIKVEVPVMIVGQSVGQRNGGILDWVMHKLEIECLPKDLPEHIEVDVSNLQIGDSLHVRDLSVSNITILANEDLGVVSIAAPRTAVDTTPDTDAAQPSVIGEGE